MIIIRTTEAVTGITSQEIQQLIMERIAEITQGQPYDADIYGEFRLVEAGDTLPEIEAYLGREVIGNFEWLVVWPCCFEAVFILSDDGFGIDLLIPKLPSIDPDLLALCATYATPAESDSVPGDRHE
jgi:hypothetical protein